MGRSRRQQGISDNILTNVHSLIKSMRLIDTHAPVIVALSGGADSVALLAILSRLGFDCRAAHCNFHLRGEESMRDMRHCRTICERLGVDLYIRDFDVKAHMEQTGDSVEMACRDLRYRWFDDLLDRDGAQAVAVGHHREDRAETFILNLMRGAGIEGLTSLRYRNGNVVRPLLDLSRDDIERFLESENLDYITDSSNASDAHRRNRVRNRLFPMMEEMFPGAVDSVLQSIDNRSRTRTIYAEAIASKNAIYRSDNTIHLSRLVEAEKEPAGVLFEIMRGSGFNFSQICSMVERASCSGLSFTASDGNTVAELSHGTITLTDGAKAVVADEAYTVNPRHDIHEPVSIAVSHHPVEEFRPEQLGAYAAYFDAAAIEENHLWQLRHYRRGDRMVPFGAVKSKLVSDLFAAAKYSAEEKRRAWLLTCDGEIVWITGLRNSSFAPIGPHTKRYIRLRLNPE